MNILLTGHGLLGEALAHRLVSMGHKVRVISREHRPGAEWEVKVGCFYDFDFLLQCMEGIDVVVHNAACQENREDLRSHILYIKPNFMGTLNVFYAAAVNNVHVVAASSEVVTGFYAWDAAYFGRALYYNENTAYNPKNIYDMSKVFMEQIGRYYRDNHGLSITLLRYGNFWPPEKSLCPDFVWKLNMNCVHLDDVVEATLLAIGYRPQGEYLILADKPFRKGDEIELYKDTAKVMKCYYPEEMRWWEEKGLPIKPITWWGDIAMAKKHLQYSPKWNFSYAVNKLREIL
ncbi:MAG TPA: NAD(P)-dependent oxidoreductase [Firmicutes bacterium]|nr:NAD(P)-dependent oxidoreductase [Bacillota bacterium]